MKPPLASTPPRVSRTRARAVRMAPPISSGLVLRTKASQLAEHLHACIREGRITEPLPGTRAWSRQLGVSRRTLNAAIHELRRRGVLVVRGQNTRLAVRLSRRRAQPAATRWVRLLLFAAYRPQIYSYSETYSALQERLMSQGIELRLEVCSPARLRKYARQPSPANELIVLGSIPPVYQRLFADARKPALVLGGLAPGLSLPFVNVDQAGAVRHATFHFLRRGFDHIVLVHGNVPAAGIRSSLTMFATACAEWKGSRVTATLVPTSFDEQSLYAMVRRVAQPIPERRAFIVLAPVPIGLIVTGLLQHGVRIPQQAEVAAMFHSREAVKLYPPPMYYPSPVRAVVRSIVAAAVQFFATGKLPALRKTLEAEPVWGR